MGFGSYSLARPLFRKVQIRAERSPVSNLPKICQNLGLVKPKWAKFGSLCVFKWAKPPDLGFGSKIKYLQLIYKKGGCAWEGKPRQGRTLSALSIFEKII